MTHLHPQNDAMGLLGDSRQRGFSSSTPSSFGARSGSSPHLPRAGVDLSSVYSPTTQGGESERPAYRGHSMSYPQESCAQFPLSSSTSQGNKGVVLSLAEVTPQNGEGLVEGSDYPSRWNGHSCDLEAVIDVNNSDAQTCAFLVTEPGVNCEDPGVSIRDGKKELVTVERPDQNGGDGVPKTLPEPTRKSRGGTLGLKENSEEREKTDGKRVKSAVSVGRIQTVKKDKSLGVAKSFCTSKLTSGQSLGLKTTVTSTSSTRGSVLASSLGKSNSPGTLAKIPTGQVNRKLSEAESEKRSSLMNPKIKKHSAGPSTSTVTGTTRKLSTPSTSKSSRMLSSLHTPGIESKRTGHAVQIASSSTSVRTTPFHFSRVAPKVEQSSPKNTRSMETQRETLAKNKLEANNSRSVANRGEFLFSLGRTYAN